MSSQLRMFFSAALAGGKFRVFGEVIDSFTKIQCYETEEKADTANAATKFSFVHARYVA
jgi:hypothetical protein